MSTRHWQEGRKSPESFPSLSRSPIISIKYLHFMSLLPLSSHTYPAVSWISCFGSYNNSLCLIGSPAPGSAPSWPGQVKKSTYAKPHLRHFPHASDPRPLSWTASSFSILFINTSLLTMLESLVPAQPALQVLQTDDTPSLGWTHLNPAQGLPACFLC